MNKYIKIVFAFVFTLFQHYSEAQQNDSLLNYLKIAGENNTGLKSEFLKYSASLERTNQVGSLPDPQMEFGYFLKPMEVISGKQIADIKLMQMFPWFGALKAAKDEASKMAAAKFESFIAYRNELYFNVKSVYYQLFQTKKEIDITEQNIKILKSIEQLALIKYQSGSGNGSTNSVETMNSGTNSQSSGSSSMSGMGNSSQSGKNSSSGSSSMQMSGSMTSGGNNGMVNLFRVQIEINSLENNLAWLKDKLKTEKVSFNSYLNRLPNAEVYIEDSLMEEKLSIDVNSLIDSIPNNPMIKMYVADSVAYTSRMKMIKRMSYPMVGIGLNYSIISKSEMSSSSMNGNDMIMPMITFSLPIYRKKYNSMIKEAEYLREASSNSSVNAIQEIRASFQQVIQNLDDADRRLLLYSKQSGLAEQSLNLIIASFSANGSDFEEILRMEQQLLDFQFKKIEAITDKNKAIAQILLLTGN